MPVYGIEHAVGQADNRVQIALGEKRFLDARLHAFAEERAVGQHQAGAAAGLQEPHQQHEEKVGGLTVRNSAGKLASMPSSSMPPKGGLVTITSTRSFGRPVAQRARQRVVMADIGRDVDAMQKEIGHAQHVRQVLLLDAGEAFLDGSLVDLGLCLLAQVLDGADEEAAGAAGGIEDRFAELRIDLLDDELRHRARRVELAGVTRGLQVLEQLLVDVAEHVAVIRGVEVDAVDLVDDLPHEGAVLHVIVGILEGHADQAGDLVAAAGRVT